MAKLIELESAAITVANGGNPSKFLFWPRDSGRVIPDDGPAGGSTIAPTEAKPSESLPMPLAASLAAFSRGCRNADDRRGNLLWLPGPQQSTKSKPIRPSSL